MCYHYMYNKWFLILVPDTEHVEVSQTVKHSVSIAVLECLQYKWARVGWERRVVVVVWQVQSL